MISQEHEAAKTLALEVEALWRHRADLKRRIEDYLARNNLRLQDLIEDEPGQHPYLDELSEALLNRIDALETQHLARTEGAPKS